MVVFRKPHSAVFKDGLQEELGYTNLYSLNKIVFDLLKAFLTKIVNSSFICLSFRLDMTAESSCRRSLADDMERASDDSGSMSHDQESSEASTIPWAPDGGWGWMVVFAVFMVNFLIDGCAGSFGILYPELLQEYNASPATTSMAGSLIVAVYLFSSMYNKYSGQRLVLY